MHVLSCSLGCFQDFNLFSVLVFILTEKGLHVCTHLKFYFHKDLFTKKTFSTLFMQCCKHILGYYETYENSAFIYSKAYVFSQNSSIFMFKFKNWNVTNIFFYFFICGKSTLSYLLAVYVYS